jgi:hypothetical protein
MFSEIFQNPYTKRQPAQPLPTQAQMPPADLHEGHYMA